MSQLIHKGGFRERANRSRRYGSSENRQTTLTAYGYRPTVSASDADPNMPHPTADQMTTKRARSATAETTPTTTPQQTP